MQSQPAKTPAYPNMQQPCSFTRMVGRWLRQGSLDQLLGLPLAYLPAPRSKHMDNLGGNRSRQRDADEDEALVDGVCKRKLRSQT